MLVLDDLERLDDGEDAWAVVEALVRYMPPAMRIVLISRRDVPAAATSAHPAAAALGETDLAFTIPEAADALAALGTEDVDADAAVRATGGWVTGVLFEVWRAASHTAGTGGEADPLRGYLAAHIVGRLGAEDTDFLERTRCWSTSAPPGRSSWGSPTPASGSRPSGPRTCPWPGTRTGRVMRCHPRFREYLVARLERRPSAEVRALRLAHGRLLAGRGSTRRRRRGCWPRASRPRRSPPQSARSSASPSGSTWRSPSAGCRRCPASSATRPPRSSPPS